MSKSLTSLTGDHQHYCRTCRREFEGQLLVKIRRRGVGLVARSNLRAGVRDAATSPARGTGAAAERAIRARHPVVDLGLEVRDACVAASSLFEPLRRRGPLEPDRRQVLSRSGWIWARWWRAAQSESGEGEDDGWKEAANRVACMRPGRTVQKRPKGGIDTHELSELSLR